MIYDTIEEFNDLCYDVGLVLDIKFNAKKSSLLQVGRHFSSLISNLHVGCDDITWNDNLRYLGAWLHKGKRLSCDINHAMRKFYASANSVFSHAGSVSEITKLYLLESLILSSNINLCCGGSSTQKKQIGNLNTC